jgi:hypothetical protein
MTVRRNDEERLQRAVVQLLTLAYPALRWRAIPNGEYRSPRTAGRLKAMGVQPGVADLHITLPGGLTGWIELKSETGRQSEEQRNFEIAERADGAAYNVCRSLDEVQATLKAWGIRPAPKWRTIKPVSTPVWPQ